MLTFTYDKSYNPPKLFLGTVKVIEIMPKIPKIRVNLKLAYQCYPDTSGKSFQNLIH